MQILFKTGINRAMTRTFPGADIGSKIDLVLLIIKVRQKRSNKQKIIRLKFNLEKLKDPTIAESFQATIGGNLQHC